MLKYIWQIFKTARNKKNLNYLKIELIEKYEILHKKIKKQEHQVWEEDYFKEVLIDIQQSGANIAPTDVLNTYMNKYFEEIGYDALIVGNDFMYENIYNLIFLTRKEYDSLTETIFNQQTKIIDIASERARTLILKATEDFIISSAIYNSDYHKGEA